MKRPVSNLFLVLTFLVLSGASFAQSQPQPQFEGEWINVDPKTRGLTRLVISREENGWGIQAWGRCHPSDCVWGIVPLEPIGKSVTDSSFNRGFAIWDPGFATNYVTLRLEKGHLFAEMITIFKDRSRR